MTTLLEQLLAELQTCTVLAESAPVYHLSSLGVAESASVADVWPALPTIVRRQVVARLVEMAETDVEMDFGAVYRIAIDDEDAEVRQVAIEGLWEDEDVRLVPQLAARLLKDGEPGVRAAAAKSLGRFVLLGELEKIRRGPSAAAYEALLQCCNRERNVEVWRRALESLAYVGNEDVAALIEQAYGASEDKLRASALFAMGRSSHERWAVRVRRELFSPNPELRYEGARACGELSLADAVDDLEELADDVDNEVREAALLSLGQIGGDRARQVLERHCVADDDGTRLAAEAALAELEFLSDELADLFERLERRRER